MRPIDADALMDYCNNQKDKTIDANDIARFPTAFGWISVKDHMPERGTLCFVYDGIRICAARYITGNEWVHGLMMSIVTHWMPLPEPPEDAHG